jgi:hypothetical protein
MNKLYEAFSISRIHETWGVYCGESHRLSDPGFNNEVIAFSRAVFSRINDNLNVLIDNLVSSGYQFASPNDVKGIPDPEVWVWSQGLEQQGIVIPISLRAFISEVGAIDLMGSNPEWPKSGYAGLDRESGNDVWYTDPLVVGYVSETNILGMYEGWQYQIKEEGRENVGPFVIEFAPDHFHKANISGGVPYSINASVPSVDCLVLYERLNTSFLTHVRNAIEWGGMPGFKYIDEYDKNIIERLRSNLLPM